MGAVEPLSWSLTIAQAVQLIEDCRGTRAWAELARRRGSEESITVDDLVEAFVVPWSEGTGCSLALLANPGGPHERAELVLSRSWAGDSALVTLEALRALPEQHARAFFSPFCLYHPPHPPQDHPPPHVSRGGGIQGEGGGESGRAARGGGGSVPGALSMDAQLDALIQALFSRTPQGGGVDLEPVDQPPPHHEQNPGQLEA